MSSYLNEEAAANRANSAMLRIERIISSNHIPPSARLALIAKVMESEPILTDSGIGARKARRESHKWNSNNCERI